MIILKILMWIVVIVLAIVLLTILGILFALLVKIQVQFDHSAEGTKLKLKYGFIGLKLLPKKVVSDEDKAKKKAKSKDTMNKVKYHVEPYARSAGNKLKASITEKAEQNAVAREIQEQEDLLMAQVRIQEEEARINAEMKQADEDIAKAWAAQANGTPLPDVVDDSRYQKLKDIKESIQAFDFEGAYNTVMSFVNGFDFGAALALIKFAGAEAKGTLGKVGKRVVFKDVNVNLGVHGKDTATTALAYGAVNSVAVPALDKFLNVANVKKSAVDIHPEFLEGEDKADVHLNFGFRPLYVVAPFVPMMLKLGKKAVPFASKTTKQIKKNKAEMDKKTEEKRKQQYAKM